jgi:hypothetical protein
MREGALKWNGPSKISIKFWRTTDLHEACPEVCDGDVAAYLLLLGCIELFFVDMHGTSLYEEPKLALEFHQVTEMSIYLVIKIVGA